MLIDFDSQPVPTATAAEPARVEVTERVSVAVRPSTSRGYLMKPDGEWSPLDLRDYVVAQIEKCSGTFPRNQRKEQAIFTRFVGEFGGQAPAIARHAFEVCGGWWSNAPISVNRFCKGSDDFFSRQILAKISS